MLSDTKQDLAPAEAQKSAFPAARPRDRGALPPSAANLASMQAKLLQSLQSCVIGMIDYAMALELHAGAPDTAVREIMHLSQSINIVNQRLATLAEPLLAQASDDAPEPTKRPQLVFPVPVRPAKPPSDGQDVGAVVRTMSRREIAVLGLLVKGLPNKLIAFELGISVVTVKAHISTILRKMNVHSRNRVIAMLANIDLSASQAN